MYAALQDRSMPLTDKVKIVRYAWQEHTLQWPNKEQELLDWMCATLSPASRKRMMKDATDNHKDLQRVWQCIYDVLHTNTCHRPQASGQSLVLKPILPQVLLSELCAHAQDKTRSCDSCDVIISCCQRVLTSPVFGYIWSSRLESMLQLLTHTTEICTKQIHDGQLSENVVSLLDTTVQLYASICRQTSNAQQIVQQISQKLFHPMVSILQAVELYTGDLTQQLHDTVKGIKTTVLKALFQKELSSYYELFLKLKTDTVSSESSPPKFLEALFNQIIGGLKNHGSFQDGVLNLMPNMYEIFVDTFRGSHPFMCFQFCQYFIQLLSVIPSDESKSIPADTSLSTNQKLICMDEILCVVCHKDVYELTNDHHHSDKQLLWLRCLSQWLNQISPEDKNQHWFNIQRHLLSLNYAIVEPKLSAFLRVTWFEAVQLDEQSTDSQTKLLSELISVYTQLRQMPKLYSKIGQALREIPPKDHISWPCDFEKHLAESVTSLPQSVVATMWEGLLEEFGKQIDTDFPVALEILCNLLSVLLLHARLADYTVTHQVSLQVAKLMSQTRDQVLKRLLAQVDTSITPRKTAAILQLVHSWGQLHLILYQYASDYKENTQIMKTEDSDSTGLHPNDLTSVHRYISSQVWIDLGSRVNKNRQPVAQLLWVKLQVQKLQYIQHHCKDADQICVSVVSVMKELLKFLPDGNTSHRKPWDKQLFSVCEETLPTAIWFEICRVLPLVEKIIMTKQLTGIAHCFVQTFVETDTTISPRQDHVTEYDVTKHLIQSGALWEMSAMTSAVVKAVWDKVQHELRPEIDSPHQSPKKKRKRLSTANDMTLTLLQQIQRLVTEDEDELITVCNSVTNRLKKSSDKLRDSRTIGTMEKLLKILQELPLENLSTSDQTKCLLAMLTLLSSIGFQSTTWSLVESSIHLIYVLQCCRQVVKTCMDHLDVKIVLGWISEKLTNFQLPGSLSDKLFLLYNTFQKQATWNVMQLERLHEHIQQAVQKYSNDSSSIWAIKLLVCNLNHTTRILHKAGIPVTITSSVKEIHDTLVPWFSNLITSLDLTPDSLTISTNQSGRKILQGLALEAYSLEFDYWGHVEDNHFVVLQTFLNTLCELCLQLLENSNDWDVLVNCLNFLSVVCNYKIRHSEFEDVSDIADPKAPTVTPGESESDEDTMDVDSSGKQVSSLIKNKHCLKPEELTYLTAFFKKSWQYLLNTLYLNKMSVKAQDCVSEEVGTKSDMTTLTLQSQDITTLTPQSREQLQKAVSQLVATTESPQFCAWMHELLDNLDIDAALQHPHRAVVSLDVCCLLVDSTDMKQEILNDLANICQKLVLQLQQLLSQLSHSWQSRYSPLVVAALNTQQKFVTWGKGLLSAQCVSTMLHSCNTIPLEDIEHQVFVAHFTAIQHLLKDMLMFHRDTVCSRIPAFCLVIRRLLSGLVWYGRQQEGGTTEREIEEITQCAHLMDRLLGVVATNKVEFSKVAMYIISDYTHSIQKVTLIPRVKKTLLPGIYHCLNLCDQYAIAALHTTLAPGVKDIFKVLYDEYKKYHKYTGRV